MTEDKKKTKEEEEEVGEGEERERRTVGGQCEVLNGEETSCGIIQPSRQLFKTSSRVIRRIP